MSDKPADPSPTSPVTPSRLGELKVLLYEATMIVESWGASRELTAAVTAISAARDAIHRVPGADVMWLANFEWPQLDHARRAMTRHAGPLRKGERVWVPGVVGSFLEFPDTYIPVTMDEYCGRSATPPHETTWKRTLNVPPGNIQREAPTP